MSLLPEAIETKPQAQPRIIYLLHDIDGATRDPGALVFPLGTTFKMLLMNDLRVTEAQVRRMIELGSRTPESEPLSDPNFDSDDIFSQFLSSRAIDMRRHDNRPLIAGVRESIDIIRIGGAEAGRKVIWSNLSGREPYLHSITYSNQLKDGLLSKASSEELDLNPGVGSYNHKVYRAYCRLMGIADFENEAGNVVMVEDDWRAIRALETLNELPEVKANGTKILMYWKQLTWNPAILLWWAGIKPNPDVVIPFNDHINMAYNCLGRINRGVI